MSTTNFIGKATRSGFNYVFPAYNQAAGHTILIALGMYVGNYVSTSDTAGNNANYVPMTPIISGSSRIQFIYVQNCMGNSSNVITVTMGVEADYSGAMAWDLGGVVT